jgi:hypothetical protein
MMTPEERFTRMENLVHSIVEMQAELSQRHAELTERQVKQQILIEQDRTAIRDLITISRSLIEAQKGLQETVREHEGRIEALIDIVDRIIRRDQPPS